MTPLREEFEKAFIKEYGSLDVIRGEDGCFRTALWAAKWMADLIAHGKNDTVQAPCTDEFPGCCVYHTREVSRPYTQNEIRSLAKELDGGKP